MNFVWRGTFLIIQCRSKFSDKQCTQTLPRAGEVFSYCSVYYSFRHLQRRSSCLLFQTDTSHLLKEGLSWHSMTRNVRAAQGTKIQVTFNTQNSKWFEHSPKSCRSWIYRWRGLEKNFRWWHELTWLLIQNAKIHDFENQACFFFFRPDEFRSVLDCREWTFFWVRRSSHGIKFYMYQTIVKFAYDLFAVRAYLPRDRGKKQKLNAY